MASKADLNTIQQLLLSGEPISAAELRELAIRHILSAPDDPKNAPLTGSLCDAYLNVYKARPDDGGVVVRSVGSPHEANVLMRHYFHEVAPADVWTWPAAIPGDRSTYPRDILVEVATALGVRQAPSD